jgi:hypothetical protein
MKDLDNGTYLVGVIQGTSVQEYNIQGENVKSRQVRLLLGEQMDAFGEPEKIYAIIKCPEREWIRIQDQATKMKGKRIYALVNPDGYRNGTPVTRATSLTNFVEVK